eukprot:1058454-Prorocentrum_minimum.AAC.2
MIFRGSELGDPESEDRGNVTDPLGAGGFWGVPTPHSQLEPMALRPYTAMGYFLSPLRFSASSNQSAWEPPPSSLSSYIGLGDHRDEMPPRRLCAPKKTTPSWMLLDRRIVIWWTFPTLL